MALLNKLLKLKEWLTVPDAARHLTILFGEEVSEADVLRLALDGQLKLSIFFVNPTLAISVSLPQSTQEETEIQRKLREYFFREGDFVRGVWDLVMLGAERSYVEALYHGLTSGVVVDPYTGGAFFTQEDCLCVLGSAPGFPEGGVLVVRTTELEKFEEHFSSLDIQQQTEVVVAGAENAALRKRIEAVLDYARKRQFPKETSQTKMAEHIKEQHKNHNYDLSTLKQILGGRYPPMKKLGIDGLA